MLDAVVARIVNKRDFIERLHLAAEAAYRCAARMLIDKLPSDYCFTIRSGGTERGSQGPPGTIKFIGGRFLDPNQLVRLTQRRAASLLWVDGKVPAWINIGVCDYTESRTEMVIRTCATLLPADEDRLPTDYGCEPGNAICPFRIRGPHVPPDWRSVELDGRFELIRRIDV